jgi:ketosteroid isomerase-like protein
MHPNARLIETFYSSFQKRDAEGMVACYHPDVRFSDPVFHELVGPRACAMWRMLCGRAKDLEIEFRDIQADDRTGSAHWEARYLFTATGRKVHNVIDAKFEFEGGKIVRHADTFDLWRWAGMALGAKGKLLGWLPPIQQAIHKKAIGGLDEFERTRASAT